MSTDSQTTTDETADAQDETTTSDDGGDTRTIPTTGGAVGRRGPERDMLDWQVPAPVWRRFREFHADRLAHDVGLGEAVTRALREWLDRDDAGARLDDAVADLLDAVGLGSDDDDPDDDPAEGPPRKIVRGLFPDAGGSDPLAEMETTRVTVRVPVRVKEAVRGWVRSDPGLSSYGVVVGQALRMVMAGGRTGRAARRVERAVAALEDDLLDDLADETAEDEDQDDADADAHPLEGFAKTTPRGEKEAALADHLGLDGERPIVMDDEFREAINRLVPGDEASDNTIRRYRDNVLGESYQYRRHPTAPAWYPTERLAEGFADPVVEKLDGDPRVAENGGVAASTVRNAIRKVIGTGDMDDAAVEEWEDIITDVTLSEPVEGTRGSDGYIIPALSEDDADGGETAETGADDETVGDTDTDPDTAETMADDALDALDAAEPARAATDGGRPPDK